MPKIKYQLYNGAEIELTVKVELAEELHKEKQFKTHLKNEYDRYGEGRSIYDENIEYNHNLRSSSAENECMDNLFLESLCNILLKKHNSIHVERFILYYVYGYTMSEIAKMQKRKKTSIIESVEKIKSELFRHYFVE